MFRLFIILFRRALFFLVLCLAPLFANAQQVHRVLTKTLENISSFIPTDRIFLHTDRNQYQAGDTIFFQTYIEDRFTQKFETASHSSWVLLLDSENEILDSARFRIDYSLAPGCLVLPENSEHGWYRIKAFTSLMQNYDPSFASTTWIRVDDLIRERVSFDFLFNHKAYTSKDTVEINLDIKDQNGEPLRNTSFSYSTLVAGKAVSSYRSKTSRNGKSLLRIYLPDSLSNKSVSLDLSLENGLGDSQIDIPRHSENPDIRFLPEGGTFISGYPQNIAFNAVSRSGRQLFLRGIIKDDLGNFIDSVNSGPMGPGLVQITPEKDRQYHAEFSGYPNKNWNLPEVSNTDPLIKINKGNGHLEVDIAGPGSEELYYLALTKNYNIVAFTPFTLNKQKRIKYNTDSVPSGMARITLFNKDLMPLAERCFFISRKNLPAFKISTEYKFYLPEQQTKLDIEIKDAGNKKYGGLFSIAVVDSALALNPQLNLHTIRDEFLFEKDFFSKVPAHIKQKGLSNISEKELDLLLMTYAWKRFNWTSADGEKQNKLIDYDKYKIDITHILSAKKKKKISKTKDPLFVLSLDDPSLISIKQENSNSYSLNISSIPPLTTSIMLVPNISVRKMAKAARVEAVVNTGYMEFSGNNDKLPGLKRDSEANISKEPEIDLDSIRVIKGINVYAKRTPAKKFVNEYEEFYQGLTTRTISDLAVKSAMSLEDLLRRLNPRNLNTSEKTIHFRPGTRIGEEPPAALFVLDGIPHGMSYMYLTDLNPGHIHSVTALVGVGGFYIYGEEAMGGVVFIETKLNNIGNKYDVPYKTSRSGGDLRKIIQLFRPVVEFYNPPKIVIQNDPEQWIRPTLYWNPEVFYDGINPVSLNYFNHQKKGTVYIILNGVSKDGEPLSGIHKYKIK